MTHAEAGSIKTTATEKPYLTTYLVSADTLT